MAYIYQGTVAIEIPEDAAERAVEQLKGQPDATWFEIKDRRPGHRNRLLNTAHITRIEWSAVPHRPLEAVAVLDGPTSADDPYIGT